HRCRPAGCKQRRSLADGPGSSGLLQLSVSVERSVTAAHRNLRSSPKKLRSKLNLRIWTSDGPCLMNARKSLNNATASSMNVAVNWIHEMKSWRPWHLNLMNETKR